MDPYQSSGYKSDRAREQAKAFKTPPPAGGFVAPGFPVDTVPPPSVTAPAAAAGSAAGGFIAATVGGVVIGGYLGYKVRQDIKKFEKYSKQPFYDAAKWQKHYSDDAIYGIGFDPVADAQIKLDIRRILETVPYEGSPGVYIAPDNGILPDTAFDPDGDHAPFQVLDNGIRFFRYETCAKTGPVLGWKSRSLSTCVGTTGWGTAPNSNNCGASQLISGTYVGSPDNLFFCPANTTLASTQVMHLLDVTVPGVGHRAQPDVIWQLDGLNLPLGHPYAEGTFTAADPVPGSHPGLWLAEGDFTDAADAWEDAVATPGTQPSLDEQVLGDELGHGRSWYSYVVPFSLNHPFTVIDAVPGSPPVTVPGVEIDPGTATEPGSVTIIPPDEPPFADASEARQQKPKLQKFIHAGHVAINFVTETNDLFQALVKGLPKALRPKGPRGAQAPPWEILQAIWDHWDQFDSQVALEAFVNNQIEDAIYGRYFGLKSKAQKRLGVSAGLARGVRGTPYTNKFAGTQTLVVPEVHFAHGAHSVSFGDYEINLVPR